ncbi:MAG TPA: winged helix-turn-helix domain-containing protein [Terriglobales bacterium]|nr:winged helix-turn-helix domain-containing protein [Terriglobales bacterium]
MSESQYKFAEFQLDCASFELRRQGRAQKSERVSLERIPMELLILLLERQGSVVTRQEIVDRLWGKDVFVDTEHGINTAIRKIRQALKDNPEQPRFILTVTGKGYCFVAGENGNQRSAAPSETPTVIPERQPRPSGSDVPERGPDAVVMPAVQSNRAKLAIVIAICVVVAAILISFLRHRIVRANQASQIHSIAVIPLANLSGDAAQDYFADGMTDELITALAKNRNLRIVSRTSAMQYKGVKRPLPDIARELNVDGILEGSVSRVGNRVHTTVQLIHAPSDAHIWAESYDRDLSEVIFLPEELSQTIAKEVKAAVSPPTRQRSISPEAHDAYLQGLYFWYRGDFDHSKQYFQKAIDLQPDYAAAWAGLGDSYGVRAGGDTPPQAAFAKNEEYSRKALELDDSVAEAHNSMAALYLFHAWDWNRAEAEAQRAIELNPNLAAAHHLRSYILFALNRNAEALQEQRQATEIDPFAQPWHLGRAYLYLRQYDAAINELSARAAVQKVDGIEFILSDAYRFKGMNKEAARHLELGFLAEDDQHSAKAVRRAFDQGGYRAVAEWLLRRDQDKAREEYVSPFFLALDYARLERKDDTLHFLEGAFEERSPEMVFLEKRPHFDFLHFDLRFQALVRKVGLPAAP